MVWASVLLCLLGDALNRSFERTRLVLEILLGECLLGRREFARSAAARLIMQACRSGLVPFLGPRRPSNTMDPIGLRNILARLALRTQQQTMSAAPRSE